MKLTGQAYLDYWRTRMARGPEQAGFDGKDADRQGQDIWAFMGRRLEELQPRSALEFGCGHGRILRRLRQVWPDAQLYGVDICQEALDAVARDWDLPGPPKLSVEIPKVKVDVIVDCLALQHVTDDCIRADVAGKLRRVLKRRGTIILLENISQPGADHVWDAVAHDYMALWPNLSWTDVGVLALGTQGHALMMGKAS